MQILPKDIKESTRGSYGERVHGATAIAIESIPGRSTVRQIL